MAEALPPPASAPRIKTVRRINREDATRPQQMGPRRRAHYLHGLLRRDGGIVERRTTQIGLFHELIEASTSVETRRRRPQNRARERTAVEAAAVQDSVDGCGHEHGRGVVFAFGLRASATSSSVCASGKGVLGEPRQLNIVGLSGRRRCPSCGGDARCDSTDFVGEPRSCRP